MSIVRVVWGRRTAIGTSGGEEVRTMVQEFGSAKKAAEFMCDLLYVLHGPSVANAWSDKQYTVSRDRPVVRYDNAARDEWVEAQLFGARPWKGVPAETDRAAIAP